jgi:hypothetical protein
MDEDEDDMPSGTVAKDDTSRLGVIKEETVIEEPKKDAEEEGVIPDEVVHEAAVGKGLAGALKFLQERGTLNEGTNWGGRTTDKKKSKLVGIEDGPKEIRIERMDEFGRVVSKIICMLSYPSSHLGLLWNCILVVDLGNLFIIIYNLICTIFVPTVSVRMIIPAYLILPFVFV